ncbi:MAG: tRNA (guanosine(46)-N7)-methyltransferase TrmB [Alphaproteobacteria bacterium]|jgi:tRNA (guanine-N7-)-methyltransferase|nr:tRNA (guanosine(46)-N7)-methyltransferase TrmB [Alphaproteobacteria bacterium]
MQEDKENTWPKLRLFGRRRGRPLRAGRAVLMDTLLPKLKIALPEEGKSLLPLGLFGPEVREVWLEIGFGGGEHLAAQAASNPSVGLIGCEPFLDGVASLVRHVDEQGLQNVRILPDDARLLLDCLPDQSLTRCFVLFADPWPKKRHAERRFIGKENLDRLARVMQSGGQLRLATDVRGLAQWMRERCNEHPAFVCLYDGPEPPADWIPTRYEQKGRAAGREPEYLIYKRV